MAEPLLPESDTFGCWQAIGDDHYARASRFLSTDESAFTGINAGRLSSTAYELWMACGHRGGSPDLQAGFGRTLRASIAILAQQLDSTTEWASWLRA